MCGHLYAVTSWPSIIEARRPLGKCVGGPNCWSGTFFCGGGEIRAFVSSHLPVFLMSGLVTSLTELYFSAVLVERQE